MEFKIGDRVEVTVGIGKGECGKIVSPSPHPDYDWSIMLDGYFRAIGYSEHELAPAATEPPQPGTGAAGDVTRDMDAFDYSKALLMAQFIGKVDADSPVWLHFKALEQWKREALETEAALRIDLADAVAERKALQTRIEWAEEILDGAEREAPKDWPGDEEYEVDHDWYMTGVYVREYRAEYPKAAQPTDAGEGGGAVSRVVNFHDVKQHWNTDTRQWDSDEYVYIGRRNLNYNLPQSPFANHFPVKGHERDEVIRKYRVSIMQKIDDGLVDLEVLRGKTLVCWCKPQACHGDVLIELLADANPAD